jgi:hypothetical protein
MIGISETWKDQRQLWEPHLGDEDKDEGRRGGMRAASSQGLSALRSPLQIKKIAEVLPPSYLLHWYSLHSLPFMSYLKFMAFARS